MWSYVIISALIVFLILAILAAIIGRGDRAKMKKTGKYPKGHFISQWMAMGLVISLPFGIAFENISLGLPIGLLLGLAIGTSIENKMKKQGKIRPLTKEEKKRQKIVSIAAIIIFVILAIVSVIPLFLR